MKRPWWLSTFARNGHGPIHHSASNADAFAAALVSLVVCGSRLSRGGFDQLVQGGAGANLFVPSADAEVYHQTVGAFVLAVDAATAGTFGAAVGLECRHRFIHVIHIEADVVDALDGGWAFAKVGGRLPSRSSGWRNRCNRR